MGKTFLKLPSDDEITHYASVSVNTLILVRNLCG